MTGISENVPQRGDVEIIIDYNDGREREVRWVRNAILQTAKNSHANALVNNFGNTFQYYIDHIIFGTNGTLNGVPKVVDASRNGLFGVTLLNKPVLSIVNPQMLSQAIFTAVIANNEANGNIINEIALVMKSGDLYSMVTLGGISKSASMQITLNWRLSFV